MFSDWGRHTAGIVEIIALQLPGREKRFGERFYETVAEAATGLLPAVQERLNGQLEVMLFGHSMGAVLAYELARTLITQGWVSVAQLFVSGSPAPWVQRAQRATGLSDKEFLALVSDFAGYRHTALEEDEMRDLLLPVLRADVAMHEGYEPSSTTPIAAPITSIRGLSDQLVSRNEAFEWRFATSESFDLMEIPGGHMYLVENPALLIGAIARLAAARQGLQALPGE